MKDTKIKVICKKDFGSYKEGEATKMYESTFNTLDKYFDKAEVVTKAVQNEDNDTDTGSDTGSGEGEE